MNLDTIDRGSFSGHETFPFRYTWLPKAVARVAEDGRVFAADDAMVRFGVGKNMVRSIRHWGLATGILEEDGTIAENRGRVLRPSSLGEQLFGSQGWDPYLEDPATLWLLHWQLASTVRPCTTWFWVFNHAPQLEFSKSELVNWLLKLSHHQGWSRVSEASLRRDVDCFVRTYAPRRTNQKNLEDSLDCPLVELGLLQPFGANSDFIMSRGQQPSLPDELFAYSIISMLSRIEQETRTVALDTISFAEGSPGRVFGLSERALLGRLERLDSLTDGRIVFDETAGLRQLLIRELPKAEELLHSYYSSARAGVAA